MKKTIKESLGSLDLTFRKINPEQTKVKNHLISIVAPVFNESEIIATFIEECKNVLESHFINYEIILVDDGSTDHSFEIMKNLAKVNPSIRVIGLSRNYGREIAMTAGLDASIGDFVVIMDSDLQDPPEIIPQLYASVIKGYDICFAARISREGESWAKKFTSKMFYNIARRISKLNIPNNAGDFRIFSRKVVNSILSLKEHNRYLKMLYAYVGFRATSIPFHRNRRGAGKSKYNYIKLFSSAFDAFISFSMAPLRITSFICITLSMSLLVYSAVIFFKKLFGATIMEGWTSLMLVNSLMFSFLFLFLSIISEYIGRTLVETKNRPLYYINEEVGGTAILIESTVEEQ